MRKILLAVATTVFGTIVFGTSVLGLTSASFAQVEDWQKRGWNTDFSTPGTDLSEVINVIGKDDIPAIDNPKFQPAKDETRIPGNEPVVAFTHEGVARAYPVRYLMWHEIVNDTIAGLPVAVTYCPLCNTSIVFERTLDGKPVTFGTSGKLRHSDLIMYDRGEENWWQQFSGRAIAGTRLGQKLKALPSFLISFDLYRERYPDGEVLLPDPARAGSAGINPYQKYDSTPIPFLFRGDLPKDIEPMARIALVDGEKPVAVALSYLRDNAPVKVGDLEFRWQEGQASALDTTMIAKGADVGNIEVYDVSATDDGTPVVYAVTFAFAARAFIPDLKILQ